MGAKSSKVERRGPCREGRSRPGYSGSALLPAAAVQRCRGARDQSWGAGSCSSVKFFNSTCGVPGGCQSVGIGPSQCPLHALRVAGPRCSQEPHGDCLRGHCCCAGLALVHRPQGFDAPGRWERRALAGPSKCAAATFASAEQFARTLRSPVEQPRWKQQKLQGADAIRTRRRRRRSAAARPPGSAAAATSHTAAVASGSCSRCGG